MRRARIVPAAIGSIALVVAIGCEAAPAPLPILTDPIEALTAGLDSTAGLHGVHLRVEVGLDAPNGGGPSSQTLELDVDLDSRSFAGRSVSRSGNVDDSTTEIIATGGMQYTRFQPDTRWMGIQNAGRAPVPANEELVRLVAAILARDTVDVRLAEPAPCNESTCYHVVVDADGRAATELLGPIVTGGAATLPVDGSIGATSIDVYIDQATRRLVAANTAFRFNDVGFQLALVLSNHDIPVQVVPPPPGLVDNGLNNVGGGGAPAAATIAPAPVPAESP